MRNENPPQCFIYTDGSNASVEAVRLLGEANIVFEELPLDVATVERWRKQGEARKFPYLISLEGDFVGLGDPEDDTRSINAFIDFVTNRPILSQP